MYIYIYALLVCVKLAKKKKKKKCNPLIACGIPTVFIAPPAGGYTTSCVRSHGPILLLRCC